MTSLRTVLVAGESHFFLTESTLQYIILDGRYSRAKLDLEYEGEFNMKKLSKQEKHDQCVREIKGTLVVVFLCAIWHIGTAFALNGTGLYFMGMPAWFSVSVFGTVLIALIGVRFLLKHVFIDFEYDDEMEVDLDE